MCAKKITLQIKKHKGFYVTLKATIECKQCGHTYNEENACIEKYTKMEPYSNHIYANISICCECPVCKVKQEVELS